MLILAIESSCDETGVALVQSPRSGNKLRIPRLLAHQLHSQIALHQDYGGVVPELASRDHIRHALPLVQATLAEAKITLGDVDVMAYTKGPGLAGALLVGAGLACAMACALGKPALGVHHLEGHLLSPFLSVNPPRFPFLALLVSGGHTQLVQVQGVGGYTLLGESIDDAAGEAFDKTAKLLGLGYPGGAALSRLALKGDRQAYVFPRPLLRAKNLNFSFSGLKTAVLMQVQKLQKAQMLEVQQIYDLAASTQEAIVEVLVKKTLLALQQTGLSCLVVAGGVGANTRLRECLTAACEKQQVQVHYPELAYCTDNGAMIALAAAMRIDAGVEDATLSYDFSIRPRWPLIA